MSFTASALVLTWAALLLLSLVVAGLVRQVHELQRSRTTSAPRPAGRGRVGAIVPPIDGVDPTRVRVLLLLDAGCDACASLLDGIAGTLSEQVITRDIALLYAGDVDPDAIRLGVPLVAGAREVFDAIGATALPYGIAVDPSGRVAAATPIGAVAQLMPLLDAAALDDSDPTHRSEHEVNR